MLEGNKRPRSEDTDSSEAKRRSSISESISSTTSNLESISSTNGISESVPQPLSILSDNSRLSSSITDVEQSSKTAAFQIIASHPPRSAYSSSHLDRPQRQNAIRELDDDEKAAIRAYLNVDFDPWGANLTAFQQGQVTIGLWKLELRKRERYFPDYPEGKAQHFHITHEANMKICVRAMDLFAKLTDRWDYNRCLHESQDDFEKFHLRNHIPRVVSNYWVILNEPRLAAFQRCIPLRHYYDEIAQDSPGFQPTALPRHHPLRIAAERNSNSHHSTQFNISDRNSNAFHTNRNSSSTGPSEHSSRSLDPDPLYTWANEKFTQN